MKNSILISEEEKRRILSMHVNAGLNSMVSEQLETKTSFGDPGDPYEYFMRKENGKEMYFTKKKGTNNWIEITPKAFGDDMEKYNKGLEAIKQVLSKTQGVKYDNIKDIGKMNKNIYEIAELMPGTGFAKGPETMEGGPYRRYYVFKIYDLPENVGLTGRIFPKTIDSYEINMFTVLSTKMTADESKNPNSPYNVVLNKAKEIISPNAVLDYGFNSFYKEDTANIVISDVKGTPQEITNKVVEFCQWAKSNLK